LAAAKPDANARPSIPEALKVRDFAREDAGFFMAWRHRVLTARGVTLRMGA